MGTWEKYQELVLKELKELKNCQCESQKELANIRVDIATLKIKSGLWGAITGSLTGIAIYIFNCKGFFK